MAMILELEAMRLSEPFLRPLDHRVLEFHDFPAFPADQMIMMGFHTRAFVEGIAACPEALSDDARLQKNGQIAVNRVPGDLKPLTFEARDEAFHAKMALLALDPLDQLQPLAGQTAPFVADKPFEFFFIFDHRGEIPY